MNRFVFTDNNLNVIWEKVRANERLNRMDGIALYTSRDLIGKARMADHVRRLRHGNKAYYVYNQHLNYTNVCTNRCKFCAFSKEENEAGSYTLSLSQVETQLRERIDEPIRELHVVGGIHPSLPYDYYLDLLKTIKVVRPDAAIKAFTAVEIDHFARISGNTIQAVILQLKDAGLDMMPGGGAEVMNDRVREALFPDKIGKDRWSEIVEATHTAGLTSNATMLYGHIETVEERVDHLIRLRAIQDRTGGFSAFIPLAFHSQNTSLDHLPPTTGVDDLTNIATARLMLDNFDHIKAYWVMIGEKLAQVALSFGADDLDGTILEEKITHTAGATSAKGLSSDQMTTLIKGGGFDPVERDSFYNPIGVMT